MPPTTEPPPGEALICPLRDDHAESVCALVNRLFDAFVAADATPAGREAFRACTRPEALADRVARGQRYTVALARGEPVGVVGVGEGHLYWLFVATAWQRRGIARRLLDHAIGHLREAEPDITELTVFSSAYAVPAYRRLGFRVTGEQTLRDGLPVTPMALSLSGGGGR
jgi:ribosomal protein S18 acetylase RimI-like enzyme